MIYDHLLLLAVAALVGFTHSLISPDHSLPIILMSWEKKWSPTKALVMTAIFGTAHVLSAFMLGLVGIHLGTSAEKIAAIQSFTGNVAAWGLIGFGLASIVWGLKRLYKGSHPSHENFSPGILFLLFVLGPCELLIPILMIPAAHQGVISLTLVTAVFYVSTVGTMMALVFVGLKSLGHLPMKRMEKFAPVLAGAGVLACGIAVKFLGL